MSNVGEINRAKRRRIWFNIVKVSVGESEEEKKKYYYKIKDTEAVGLDDVSKDKDDLLKVKWFYLKDGYKFIKEEIKGCIEIVKNDSGSVEYRLTPEYVIMLMDKYFLPESADEFRLVALHHIYEDKTISFVDKLQNAGVVVSINGKCFYNGKVVHDSMFPPGTLKSEFFNCESDLTKLVIPDLKPEDVFKGLEASLEGSDEDEEDESKPDEWMFVSKSVCDRSHIDEYSFLRNGLYYPATDNDDKNLYLKLDSHTSVGK